MLCSNLRKRDLYLQQLKVLKIVSPNYSVFPHLYKHRQ